MERLVLRLQTPVTVLDCDMLTKDIHIMLAYYHIHYKLHVVTKSTILPFIILLSSLPLLSSIICYTRSYHIKGNHC